MALCRKCILKIIFFLQEREREALEKKGPNSVGKNKRKRKGISNYLHVFDSKSEEEELLSRTSFSNFFLELLSRTDYFRIFTSRKLVLRFSERTHKALRLRLAPDFFKSWGSWCTNFIQAGPQRAFSTHQTHGNIREKRKPKTKSFFGGADVQIHI